MDWTFEALTGRLIFQIIGFFGPAGNQRDADDAAADVYFDPPSCLSLDLG